MSSWRREPGRRTPEQSEQLDNRPVEGRCGRTPADISHHSAARCRQLQDAEQMFDLIDADSSGSIDLGEFDNAFAPSSRPGVQALVSCRTIMMPITTGRSAAAAHLLVPGGGSSRRPAHARHHHW